MDYNEIYVLETKDKEWAYEKKDKVTISNCYSINKPDVSSKNFNNFKKDMEDPLYTYFSGSKIRKGKTSEILTKESISLSEIMKTLRNHSCDAPLISGSVSSVCMHAGKIIGDHTTASMIVELGSTMHVYVTGCSLPCLSIFKEIEFGHIDTDAYWLKREKENRNFIGKVIPDDFYKEKEELEKKFLTKKYSFADMCKKEDSFYSKWISKLPKETKGSIRFKNYWKKKNIKLGA